MTASIRGASHRRSGQPNQDAIAVDSPPTGNTPLILALSDGHGSAKCFRSDVGSRLAVEAAVEVLQRFLDGEWKGGGRTVIKRTAEERLPQELVRVWRQRVEEHLSQVPLTPPELEELASKEGDTARAKVESNRFLVYGATLLLAVVTDAFILFLQLGDGDILVVSASGEVTNPIARDHRLFANETTSLSGEKAWADFHTAFIPTSERDPALVVVSTDGYANSFRDEASFLKVGSDLLGIVRDDGYDAVSANLEGWLTEASTAGSGDDVTVGLLVRDFIPRPTASVDAVNVLSTGVEVRPATLNLTPLDDSQQPEREPFSSTDPDLDDPAGRTS